MVHRVLAGTPSLRSGAQVWVTPFRERREPVYGLLPVCKAPGIDAGTGCCRISGLFVKRGLTLRASMSTRAYRPYHP